MWPLKGREGTQCTLLLQQQSEATYTPHQRRPFSCVWHNVGYIININVSILPYTHHIKVRLFKEPARAEYNRLVLLQLYGFSLCLGDHLKK